MIIRSQLEKLDDNSLIINHNNEYYIFSSEKLDDIKINEINNSTVNNSEVNVNESMDKYYMDYFLTKIPQIEELNVEKVNIYKDEILSETNKIVSYNVGISEDKFLFPSYNMYFVTDKEMNGYYNELMLEKNVKDNLLYKVERLKCIYESEQDISDETIREMWQKGKFFKDWARFIYQDSKKFSRLELLYYS